MFGDQPVVGVGAGNFPTAVLERTRRRPRADLRLEERTPHSIVFEVATETGILGLAAFGSLLVVAFGSLRQDHPKPTFRFAARRPRGCSPDRTGGLSDGRAFPELEPHQGLLGTPRPSVRWLTDRTFDGRCPLAVIGAGTRVKDSRNLSRIAVSGAAWSLSGLVVGRLVTLASTIVLVRLLSPDDFGLMALGLLLVGYSEALNDLGLDEAVVIYGGRGTQIADVAYTMSVAIGVGFAVAGFLSAPLLADAFG